MRRPAICPKADMSANATKQRELYRSCMNWIYFAAFWNFFSALCLMTAGSYSSFQIVKNPWLTPRYDALLFLWSPNFTKNVHKNCLHTCRILRVWLRAHNSWLNLKIPKDHYKNMNISNKKAGGIKYIEGAIRPHPLR